MTAPNRYKFNDGTELNDELELNYYETFYRNYDAQIGRFTGIDIMAESYYNLSPYHFGNNNPIFYNDPNGDQYSYKDANGNKWHAPDPLAGTGAGGSYYQPGFGFDGFGDLDNGNSGGGNTGNYGSFWESLINATVGDTRFVNSAGANGEQFFNYSNATANFETPNPHGGSFFTTGEWYFYSGITIKMDFDWKSVGQPGLGENIIPVWGSGRAAVDDFQNGKWGWGIVNTALAISDVFLVKSIVTGIGKIAFRTAATEIGESVTRQGTNLVYHGFDANGVVRYVGITERAAAERFAEHVASLGTGRELLNYVAAKYWELHGIR